MSKKKKSTGIQMQKQSMVHKPSAILGQPEPGEDLKDFLDRMNANLTPYEINYYNNMPPRVGLLLIAYAHQDAHRHSSAYHEQASIWGKEFMQAISKLQLHIHTVDILVEALQGKQLRTSLDSKLPDMLQKAYNQVCDKWGEWREYGRRLSGEYMFTDFKTRRPDIYQSVSDRIQALKNLKTDADETFLRSIEPIHWAIDDLVSTVTKTGRKSDKLDLLRARWTDYETHNPDKKPADVREALLAELATGDIRNGYTPKEDLTDEEKAAYISLMGKNARRNVSGYRFDLLGRK